MSSRSTKTSSSTTKSSTKSRNTKKNTASTTISTNQSTPSTNQTNQTKSTNNTNNNNSSCVDPNTILNEPMIDYMDSILKINKNNNIIKDELFTGETLECVNSSIRNGNFYMLDKYGLPIRKNFQDSRKSAFGWKYNANQEPINIHINDILLQTESDDIQIITLQQLKTQFPTLFKPPRGIIYKIYSTEYPNINIDAL